MKMRLPMLLTALCLVALLAATASAKDRRLFAVGDNGSGQLGLGDNLPHLPVFTLVPGLTDVRLIAAGEEHSVVVTGDGEFWGAGRGNSGELGSGTWNSPNSFTQAPGPTDVTAIGTGGMHSMAANASGSVWTTGYNYQGQLGLGGGLPDITAHYSFAAIQVPATPIAFAGLQVSSLALADDGSVYSAGSNSFGAIGQGATAGLSTFTQVAGVSDILSIAGGIYHSLAVSSDGTVYATGWNAHGQLGLGDTNNRNVFTQVTSITGAASVAAAGYSSLLLMSDGTVQASGNNEWGQLGVGSLTARNTFGAAPGLTNVTAVATGEEHALALKSDGTLWATGSNSEGQLGLKKLTTVTSFATVPGIDHVIAIAAGGDGEVGRGHSLAIAWYGVEVTAPAAADTAFEVGEKVTIRWNSFNLAKNAKVKIELVKGGADTWTLADAAPNKGSFKWTVGKSKAKPPEFLPDGTDYRIRITAPDGIDSDESDFDFGIGRVDSLTINGDETVEGGDVASYTCTAHLTGGAERDATAKARWSCSPTTYAKMGKGGVLTTKVVPSAQDCTITATYGKGKAAVHENLTVTISPPEP